MPTKHTCQCLEKVGDDEPVFVLRARDRCAPKIIRLWAEFARAEGSPEEKTQQARDIADEMEAWAKVDDRGRWPD
jgi:hypothetical protein